MIWKDEGCVLRACAVRSARCLAVVAVVLAKQTGWLGLVGVGTICFGAVVCRCRMFYLIFEYVYLC